MNFYSLIIYGCLLTGSFLLYIVNRDRQNKTTLLGRWRKLAWALITVLILGLGLCVYTRFIEPNLLLTNEQTISFKTPLTEALQVAFVADLHLGYNKKSAWAKKVVRHIDKLNPDVVLLGGDYIFNNGTVEDESQYLEPLRELAKKYPTYAVMGNHEYGLLNYKAQYNGDFSEENISRLFDLRITVLRNNLECLEINQQSLCLFGADDIYRGDINTSPLNSWDQKQPIILLTHNPDNILIWPENVRQPDLVLAGHTHGGQVYLPWVGPLGRVNVKLGTGFYRGLNYYEGTPIFTTIGAGESGGPVRFFSPPEVALLTIQ